MLLKRSGDAKQNTAVSERRREPQSHDIVERCRAVATYTLLAGILQAGHRSMETSSPRKVLCRPPVNFNEKRS